jgi:hypothetical protein
MLALTPQSIGARCVRGGGGKTVATYEAAVGRITRLAAGVGTPEDHRLHQAGLQDWLKHRAGRRLEGCLGVPHTRKRMARLDQSYYLAVAARLFEGTSRWGCAVKLAEELDIFLSRGTWDAWRNLPAPPPDASQLRAALWHVARATGGESLTAKTIERIVGQIS